MIETLISSKTRIKLLLKFFLNSNTTAYLRGLQTEFGESSNGIRQELNRLEKAGMLTSESSGNKKFFRANTTHPLFHEIRNILLKHIGLDHIVDNVVSRLGEVERVYLAGKFARGLDSSIIDLIFVGEVDKSYLVGLIERAEKIIERKIRYIIYATDEFEQLDPEVFQSEPLLLWSKDD